MSAQTRVGCLQGNLDFLKLTERHRQDAHGLVIVGRRDVLLATLRRPSPLLQLGGIGVVGEVQPVEHPPQVRVIDTHALQGGVQSWSPWGSESLLRASSLAR